MPSKLTRWFRELERLINRRGRFGAKEPLSPFPSPDGYRIFLSALRNEKCPARVRSQVRGGISAGHSTRLRLAISAALAGVVLAGGLFVWQQQAREHARQQARLAQLTLERSRVAHQAENALGLVGSILLSAGHESGKIISDRTVPPLRDSFQTAKNKLNQYINL